MISKFSISYTVQSRNYVYLIQFQELVEKDELCLLSLAFYFGKVMPFSTHKCRKLMYKFHCCETIYRKSSFSYCFLEKKKLYFRHNLKTCISLYLTKQLLLMSLKSHCYYVLVYSTP